MMKKILLRVPGEKRRVAVIEIGSKSVRLKINDIKGTDISYVDSDSRFIMPGSVIGKARDVVRQKLEQIRDAIEEFQVRAEARNSDVIETIGTEVLRNLYDTHMDLCKDIIPSAKALDGCSEAVCGLISVIKVPSTAITSGMKILLIDQGSGSVQIAAGCISNDDCLELEYSDSFPLGTNVLFAMLSRAGGNILGSELLTFNKKLGSAIYRLDSKPEDCKGLSTVVTGSVATKAVFLREKLVLFEKQNNVRANPRDSVLKINYDRDMVHGRIYTRKEITENLISYLRAARQDEKATRKFFSPENPDGTTFEEVILGLMTLKKLLERRQINSFSVSTEGTNVGMTWALALGDGVLSYYDEKH